MAFILPKSVKYLSIIVLLISILSKYEISSPSNDNKVFLLTKIATVQYDRAHVYRALTNIEKYTSVRANRLCFFCVSKYSIRRILVVSKCCTSWTCSIGSITSKQSWRRKISIVHKISTDRFAFCSTNSIGISNILGDLPSTLIIHTDDRPNRFIYSVDSWLLETNSIELKETSSTSNSTRIEWSTYTRRRSILFQVIRKSLSLTKLKQDFTFFSMFSYHLRVFIEIKSFVKLCFRLLCKFAIFNSLMCWVLCFRLWFQFAK